MLFIYLGIIKCFTAGSHHPHPQQFGVFWAIVTLGTHPVYLNPSAHSAVKPWHGGNSTPILLPYMTVSGQQWKACFKLNKPHICPRITYSNGMQVHMAFRKAAVCLEL